MKFLFLTDSQIRGNNPVSRSGSFVDDLAEKFQEVVEIGREREVDVYFHGGDFSDRPLISLGIADRFADIMHSAGKVWYVVRGNHDEIGHNPNLSGESMLDHLFRRCSFIKHLSNEPGLFFGDVLVKGFDYYHNIEMDIKEKGLMCSVSPTGKKIAIVHAFITPEPVHPSIMHVVCSEIKSDFDLVLCGHYHRDFGVVKVGKTTYVGIGALARMSIAEWDVKRTPGVLFVDTERPTMTIIPLKCAKPYENLFDLEALEKREDYESRVEDFIAGLDESKFQGLNLRGVIEELAKQKSIDREIIDEIVKRIGLFE